MKDIWQLICVKVRAMKRETCFVCGTKISNRQIKYIITREGKDQPLCLFCFVSYRLIRIQKGLDK